MRLLVITQALDRTDSQLGFFHAWVAELAARVENVTVICLREGKHQLPANVTVYSLGKERGNRSPFAYALAFYKLLFSGALDYNRVFVHMNEEYVLLAGWYWKLKRIPVALWRNHYAGSWKTNLAMVFSTKIFYTSRHSYTASSPKSTQMPVGLDDSFLENMDVARLPRSILFLGRVTPSKNPDVFLRALGILKKSASDFSARLVGGADSATYLASLKKLVEETGVRDAVTFNEGVAHDATKAVYASSEIYVNLATSGMYDKTLFEAAANGCLVLSASEDFRQAVGDDRLSTGIDAHEVAEKLSVLLALSKEEKEVLRAKLRTVASANTLSSLAERLVKELS